MSNKDVFSVEQVNQVCEQLLRERESRVREEYDSVLARELADQYSRCVKFTTEQIRRHLDRQELPSCEYIFLCVPIDRWTTAMAGPDCFAIEI